MNKSLSILLLAFALLALRSASFASDEPEATTDSYEVMAGGNATLRGTVLANSSPADVTFEYGTSTSYGQVAMASTTRFSAYRGGTVTAMLMGLNTTATYHFRVKAQNAFGITYGSDMTFNPSAPVAVTKESTALSPVSETLRGEAHGWGPLTTVSFEYGMTDSYGSTVAATPGTVSGSTLTSVTAQLSGLNGGPVYHYRLKAVNAFGTTYGADMTFQTGRPTLTALASTSLTTGVGLQGSVKLNGQAVSLKFEYGLTTAYGTEVSVSVPGGASSSAQTVSYDFTTANPQISYHYRLKATGNGATTNSQDMTTGFPAGRPNVTTLAATNVTANGVTFNGSVNANGNTATVIFQYGPTTTYGSTVVTMPDAVTGTTVTNVLANRSATNVTWHYRVVATNSIGTSYGADMVVTIPPAIGNIGSVTLSDLQANRVTVSSSSTQGTITCEYGLTNNYGNSVELATPVSNRTITGLTPATTYHLRIKATNNITTATSQDYTFTTHAADPKSPVVETLPAFYLSSTNGALNARVDGKGYPFSGGFDFGVTSAYGSTSSSFNSNFASTTGEFGSVVSNLQAGTTYHFRAFAQNGYGGRIYGPDQVFKTPALGVVVAATQTATEISTTSARLNGYYRLNNSPNFSSPVFEYGTTPALGLTSNTGPFSSQSSSVSTPSGVYAGYAQIPISGVHVRYYYRLRAKNDRSTSFGEILSFLTPDPHDASLANLTLEGVSLNEPFLPTTTAYTASLPYETQSVNVMATAAESIALLTLNNGQIEKGHLAQVMPLQVGVNNFTLQVTSWDGAVQQTFTLAVTRESLKPGSIDASFGSNGRVTTDSGNLEFDQATQTLVLPDGKILAVGSSDISIILTRYLPDGTLDSSFGNNGIVTYGSDGHTWQASALAVQSDGKILVGGTLDIYAAGDFFLQRYLANGSLDLTFNTTGIATTAVGTAEDVLHALVLQSDGKILAAGSSFNGVDDDFALVRYEPNGSIDLTFNGTGKVVTDLGGGFGESAYGLAVQGGRVVVSGVSNNQLAVACYTVAGALDATFNTTGIYTADLGTFSTGNGVTILTTGEILVVGEAVALGATSGDFLCVRLLADGTLDTTLNGTGIVTTNFGTDSEDQAHSVVRQPDGKFILAGSASGVNTSFALARYHVDGSLDTSFGSSGKALQSFGKCYHGATSVALQDDGKIIAAGDGCLASSQDISLLRLLGDGPGIMVKETPTRPLFDGISNLEMFIAPNVSTTVPLTITNTGAAALTGFSITLTGADAADFTFATISAGPVPPVAANASMTLRVSYIRTSLGTSNAVLHIGSNVSGNNGSYDIPLIGTAVTPHELWRQQYFGYSTNTEAAADLADPDEDGVVNLLEYALGLDPSVSSTSQLPQPIVDGDDFVLSFTTPTDVNGVTYGAESTAALEGNNWQSVTDTGTAPQHIFRVPRTGKPLLFMRIRVGTTVP